MLHRAGTQHHFQTKFFFSQPQQRTTASPWGPQCQYQAHRHQWRGEQWRYRKIRVYGSAVKVMCKSQFIEKKKENDCYQSGFSIYILYLESQSFKNALTLTPKMLLYNTENGRNNRIQQEPSLRQQESPVFTIN